MQLTTVSTSPTSPERLLGSKDLRITKPRIDILSILIEHDAALSQHELEQRLGPGADRVTVYRTLKTFVQEGLLHAVPDEEFGLRYALCDTHACDTKGEHHHDHMHFKCTNCGDTLCLDDVKLPPMPLPTGYRAQEITVLAKGICKACCT
jgi:Fur family transcriptional regulator, ferric uptake regulator